MRATRTIIVLVALMPLAAGAGAADKFQKLTGSQIRAKLVGMEMTDDVHWSDVFTADGTLATYAMGRKSAGKWSVKKDELCVERGKDDGGCYQVWISGQKIELRREGSTLPLEGHLQRPAAHR